MDRKIAEDASHWLLILKDASPLERREFVAWVRQSPEHLREFLAISAISDNLSACNWNEMTTLDELIRSFPENVIQFPSEHAISGKAVPSETEPDALVAPGPSLRWKAAAVAAGALVVAGAFWISQTGSTVYDTSIAEQRTVRLDDGSVMSLNTGSKAVFSMTKAGRYVTLQGEAAFTVAHDPSRPFLVKSGDVVATAIGTQFNVHDYPSGTTVSVLEGTVGITASTASSKRNLVWRRDGVAAAAATNYAVVLTAGKEAYMDRSGTVRSVETADPVRVLSWQQRLLVFRGNTIEDMIAEFNRWNHRKIRPMGRINSNERYDGVFSVSDPESFLDFLALDENIVLERSAAEIILRARTGPK